MEILCVGCTGFVGKAVRHALCEAGHSLLVVSRYTTQSSHRNESWLSYDSDWMVYLSKVDALVNLIGEPISRFWLTEDIKQSLRNSRVGICSRIMDRLGRTDRYPKVWINASAVGIYGNRGDEILPESASSGQGFLADVCKEWESEVIRSAQLGIREVRLRLGPVLGEGGMLQQLLPIYRLGLGGRIGSGEQFFPWVHLGDVSRAVVFTLENSHIRGPCNVVSPGIVRQNEFARSLARAVHARVGIPVPEFVANHLPGTLTEITTFSQHAVPNALQEQGFRFVHTDLDECLRDCVDDSSGRFRSVPRTSH